MDYSNQKDKTIILEDKGKISQFNIENIIYFECDQYLSTIHLLNTIKTETFCKQLKNIEEELAKYGFLRVNRNILVNMKYVNNINRHKRYLIMESGIELKVSRSKWHNVRFFLKNKIPFIQKNASFI